MNPSPAGPPQDRLWTEDDLATYFVFKSVGELIERHPDFPAALPLRIRGRRWRPADVIAWSNALSASSSHRLKQTEIPVFDISTITDLLEEN